MTDMSAIVGAGFPRPTGWGTRPERIRFSRLRPCVLALNIPPILNPANPLILNILIQTTPTLHSAGVLFLDQSPFYRHYAPLERKGILLSRPSINMSPLCGEKRCHYLAIRTYAVDQSVPWEKRCHGDRLGNLCLRLNLYGRMSKPYAV